MSISKSLPACGTEESEVWGCLPDDWIARPQDAELDRAVRERQTIWVVGGPRSGKSAAMLRAANAARLTEQAAHMDGLSAQSRDAALASLAAVFPDSPLDGPAPPPPEISQWLRGGWSELGQRAAIVLVSNFDQIEPSVSSLLATAVAEVPVACPILIETRTEPPDHARGLCHVRLPELDGAAGDLAAVRDGRRTPLESCGVTALCLARTSTEREIVRRAWPEIRRLVEPVLDPFGRVPRDAARAWLDAAVTKEVEAAARALLQALIARARLDPAARWRAVELCREHGTATQMGELLRRHFAPDDRAGAAASMQPYVNAMVGVSSVPVELRLVAGTLAEPSIPECLALHASLECSPSAAERDLAAISLVRAGFWSGRRVLPPRIDAYMSSMLGRADLPVEIRRELVTLWVYRAAMFGASMAEETRRLVQGLPHGDAVGRAMTAYFHGVTACGQGRFADGMAAIEDAARLLDSVHEERCAEGLRQSSLTFAYLAHDDVTLEAGLADCERRLGSLHPLQGAHWRDYPELLRAILAWQCGNLGPLNHHCAIIPKVLPRWGAPAELPRPYFRDYHPFTFAALRDRTLALDPVSSRIDLLLRCARELRPYLSVLIGCATTAQHCFALGDLERGSELCRAMTECSPAAELTATNLAALARFAATGATIEQIVEALGAATLFPERVTTPYTVLIAIHAALRHGLPRPPLRRFIEQHAPLSLLRGRPARLVAAGLRILEQGADAATVRAALPEPLAQQILLGFRPTRRSAPRDVMELRRWLDEAFRGPAQLRERFDGDERAAERASKRFKRVYGLSPSEYVQQRRVDEACCLLLETASDATSVALECGFYDAAQFGRVFKARTGLTPGAYRKRWAGHT